MKILNLTLKKKWFDMILSGEKKEEYREQKPYWVQRLIGRVTLKEFDAVRFRNGYAKNAPEMLVEFKGIDIGFAKPEWSDNWQGSVFIIELGDIMEIKNV